MFTVNRVANGDFGSSGSAGNGTSSSSSSRVPGEDLKMGSPVEDGSVEGKDKSSKKKWFNLNLRGSEKRFG